MLVYSEEIWMKYFNLVVKFTDQAINLNALWNFYIFVTLTKVRLDSRSPASRIRLVILAMRISL